MMLESTGVNAPKAIKTGTTIAGIIFKVFEIIFGFCCWK